MKILICCFLIVIYSAKSNEDEIAIYDFVLNEMIKTYSIESIILMNEQSYFFPNLGRNFRDEVFNKISEKGNKILSESDKIENFGSVLMNPIIKHRISQIELDTCFLDTNALAYKGWEKFYEKYLRNNAIISLSPIIYTKKNSIIYVYCGYLFDIRGVGILYKLKRVKQKWTIVDWHKMWVAN